MLFSENIIQTLIFVNATFQDEPLRFVDRIPISMTKADLFHRLSSMAEVYTLFCRNRDGRIFLFVLGEMY